MTTHQIVIVRRSDGSLHIIEQGLGASGMGETLNEHDIAPSISAGMATRYLENLLTKLVAVEGKQ